MSARKTVGIVGARGHTGAELIRLICRHPQLELAFVSSRELAGQRVAGQIPEFAGELCYENLDADAIAAKRADAVVLALPNGKAAPYVAALDAAKSDAVIVDLSADYRFDDGWYYGLPELYRGNYRGQRHVSNPGCYATAMQLAIAHDTLRYQDQNLQIARWRVQAGLVSSLDVEQARGQRAATAATIPQLESSLAASANAISTLIGEPPGRVLTLLKGSDSLPSPPTLAGLAPPAEVLRQRPDVRGAEETLIANSARVGVARAQLLPLLRLTGNVSTASSGLSGLFDVITGGIFATVSQLIFDGGRTRAQVHGAEAAAQGSLAAWRGTILAALEDVETASVDLKSARERVAIQEEALDAANSAALLARSQYEAGLTDFQNLLTAENQLLSARNGLVAAEADRASAFVRLTQALGGGWSSTSLPLASNDGIEP